LEPPFAYRDVSELKDVEKHGNAAHLRSEKRKNIGAERPFKRMGSKGVPRGSKIREALDIKEKKYGTPRWRRGFHSAPLGVTRVGKRYPCGESLDKASVAGRQDADKNRLSDTHAAGVGDEKIVIGKLLEADDEVDPNPYFRAIGFALAIHFTV
jgi:hypothetical protein